MKVGHKCIVMKMCKQKAEDTDLVMEICTCRYEGGYRCSTTYMEIYSYEGDDTKLIVVKKVAAKGEGYRCRTGDM